MSVPSHQEGDPDRRRVGEALLRRGAVVAPQSMIGPQVAVVGCVHDEGVREFVEIVQARYHRADHVIDRHQGAQLGCSHELRPGEVVGPSSHPRGFVGPVDLRGCRVPIPGAHRIVGMLGRGMPRVVRGGRGQDHHPGGRIGVLEPLEIADPLFADEIGGVRGLNRDPVNVEPLVLVASAGERVEVEEGRRCRGLPPVEELSNDRRRVAGGRQFVCDGGGVIQGSTVGVRPDTGVVSVASRQEHRTVRTAQGSGREQVREALPTLQDLSADVRHHGLRERVAGTLIIGEEQQDVVAWRRLRSRAIGRRGKSAG